MYLAADYLTRFEEHPTWPAAIVLIVGMLAIVAIIYLFFRGL